MSSPLPDAVLSRRILPCKPAAVTLAGSLVELRPLDVDADIDALHAVSSGRPCRLGERHVDAYDPDARVWRWMSGGPFTDWLGLRNWLTPQVAALDALPLAVSIGGSPVGVACFIANHPEHLKIELGAIWYGPIAQGTGASAEATYLMCEHAFSLGYRRVEWKCDAENVPSHRAALAYGFTYEGTQQAHMIIKNKNRDTAWFRILDSEWPEVGPKLRTYASSRRLVTM